MNVYIVFTSPVGLLSRRSCYCAH